MLKVHVSSLGAAEHYEHRPITGSACEIEWHFPALVELYRHDAPGRRPGSGSSQPGPANTDGSRATRPAAPLGGVGPRVGRTHRPCGAGHAILSPACYATA